MSIRNKRLSTGDSKDTLKLAVAIVTDVISALYGNPKIQPKAIGKELISSLDMSISDNGEGIEYIKTLVRKDFLDNVINYRHPNYFGHQRPAPLIAGVLADFAAQAFNPTVTNYDGNPVSVTIENELLKWFKDLFDFSLHGCATLTSGGSESNLTALLAARESKGLGRVILSKHAHYSVEKACYILGVCPQNIIKIDVDDSGRISKSQLEKEILEAKNKRSRVMAVVATAGTTSLGAFDDLNFIAELKRKSDFWFHVDGAHGGACVFSDKFSSRLDGLSLADSFCFDPHKLMWVSPPASIFFCRNKEALTSALNPTGMEVGYIIKPSSETSRNYVYEEPLRLSLFCTRHFTSLKILSVLKVHGINFFGRAIEKIVDDTWSIFLAMEKSNDFEVYCPPSFNIICFRHTPINILEDNISNHNVKLKDIAIHECEIFFNTIYFGDECWLRMQLMNIYEDINIQSILDNIRLASNITSLSERSNDYGNSP
ncbi:L-2,4-diaminobutyrate decarboxylase [Franzmannia pantelleriensis]|uniref:L-2,4-diaminobutyrate decarboxylase n=1 Tax=Franzmannia pantelleriensis TaxID=48727 RepID=A0A1G9IBN1_9GAMM|nr:aminotransferase class V-fold PLP-dependent enzyme [Halomonas pantelleriensis]SDL22611.1 L-2,4-diaminobutyrate decarboxylase [Halomonas pantelleriensis]